MIPNINKKRSNFYVFCVIYFSNIDLFDCIKIENDDGVSILKHAGGTYATSIPRNWYEKNRRDWYYNTFRARNRSQLFSETYLSVFGTDIGSNEIYNRLCLSFDFDVHICFHAVISLMRKKGVIPLDLAFIDYEERDDLDNPPHYQFGLRAQSVIYQNSDDQMVEVRCDDFSKRNLESYLKRKANILDDKILRRSFIVSGEYILNQLYRGDIDIFAHSNIYVTRDILGNLKPR